MTTLDDVLLKLNRGSSPNNKWPDHKGEYWSICPFHNDTNATNFSVSQRGYYCFACPAKGSLRDLAIKLGVHVQAQTSHSRTIYFLADYAKDKGLPESFLQALGLANRKLYGSQAVRIPYRDEAGQEVTARYRIAASGDKFRWTKGAHVLPYGLDKIDRTAGYIILVEGESDAQTLWFHGLPALGVPGAALWKPTWAQYVDGLTVFVWREPDQGGATFISKIGPTIPDCLVIQSPPGRKDVSACHLAGDDIPALMAQLCAAAQPYQAIQTAQLTADAATAKKKAAVLLATPDILTEFAKLCTQQGLIGEDSTAKLLYLALTSRLLERPVSVCVKGPSSGGKSVTVERVLSAFPSEAFYSLTSMSERSLAYSQEPLVHRFLVIYEAAGMAGDVASYLMRSLLSEGCIRYETVEKTADGLKPKLIERPGPTGLIVTTTAARLHPENETRMLSVTVRDDVKQTRDVLGALADRTNGSAPATPDFSSWHALQTWLELAGVRAVSIPYAHALAKECDARAVRLRRDFGAVLNLISAHAILHQETRQRDNGRIVAALEDYRVIYDLVSDVISEGVKASVSKNVRETVEAVELLYNSLQPLTINRLAKHLGLDHSAVSRRVRVAIDGGYIVNEETRAKQPAKLSIGDPLPAQESVLPTPDKLIHVLSPLAQAHMCTCPVDDVSTPAQAVSETPETSDFAPEDWQKSFLDDADTIAASVYDTDTC